MIKYKIKQVIIAKLEIELPEGSQVVSVKHRDAYGFIDAGFAIEVPERWQVVYLEPYSE